MEIKSGAFFVQMRAPIVLEFRPIPGVDFNTATVALEVELVSRDDQTLAEFTSWTFQVNADGNLEATTITNGTEFPSAGVWDLAGLLTFNGSTLVDLVSGPVVVRENRRVTP